MRSILRHTKLGTKLGIVGHDIAIELFISHLVLFMFRLVQFMFRLVYYSVRKFVFAVAVCYAFGFRHCRSEIVVPALTTTTVQLRLNA